MVIHVAVVGLRPEGAGLTLSVNFLYRRAYDYFFQLESLPKLRLGWIGKSLSMIDFETFRLILMLIGISNHTKHKSIIHIQNINKQV